MSKGKSTEKSVKAPEGKPAEAAATPSAGGGDAAPFTAKESMRLLRLRKWNTPLLGP